MTRAHATLPGRPRGYGTIYLLRQYSASGRRMAKLANELLPPTGSFLRVVGGFMDSFYILVMDKNNTAGDTWFITEWDANHDRLKALMNHSDQISRELPKANYPGTEFCKVSLINTHNGKEESGHIYAVQKTG